ncbi:hypothetical protein IAT38_002987 [Cryptococcus sp. DSM 104549]
MNVPPHPSTFPLFSRYRRRSRHPLPDPLEPSYLLPDEALAIIAGILFDGGDRSTLYAFRHSCTRHYFATTIYLARWLNVKELLSPTAEPPDTLRSAPEDPGRASFPVDLLGHVAKILVPAQGKEDRAEGSEDANPGTAPWTTLCALQRSCISGYHAATPLIYRQITIRHSRQWRSLFAAFHRSYQSYTELMDADTRFGEHVPLAVGMLRRFAECKGLPAALKGHLNVHFGTGRTIWACRWTREFTLRAMPEVDPERDPLTPPPAQLMQMLATRGQALFPELQELCVVEEADGLLSNDAFAGTATWLTMSLRPRVMRLEMTPAHQIPALGEGNVAGEESAEDELPITDTQALLCKYQPLTRLHNWPVFWSNHIPSMVPPDALLKGPRTPPGRVNPLAPHLLLANVPHIQIHSPNQPLQPGMPVEAVTRWIVELLSSAGIVMPNMRAEGAVREVRLEGVVALKQESGDEREEAERECAKAVWEDLPRVWSQDAVVTATRAGALCQKFEDVTFVIDGKTTLTTFSTGRGCILCGNKTHVHADTPAI